MKAVTLAVRATALTAGAFARGPLELNDTGGKMSAAEAAAHPREQAC